MKHFSKSVKHCYYHILVTSCVACELYLNTASKSVENKRSVINIVHIIVSLLQMFHSIWIVNFLRYYSHLFQLKHIVFVFQVIQGNSNTYTTEMRNLEPPIIGKNIRFVPYSTHPMSVCMRVETYGCRWNGR